MTFPYNKKPAFLIKTLGCKVNQYESQAMRENLIRNGFIEKADGELCDFYIINSCTVTQKADKETRGLVRHFHRINPDGKIAVAGCYVELEKDRAFLANIPGVTHLVRNKEKAEIAKILLSTNSGPGMYGPGMEKVPSRVRNWYPRIMDFKGRNRAFIKVQDGCNHRCSYCKVNLVRGPSRSRGLEKIKSEAELLIARGFKEIVLTGICLGAWGRDGQQTTLADLIKEISGIEGLFRIRLSSIEPIYVTDDIISVIRDDKKVCKHLHIPLQSGDDKILKLMNRPYTGKKFRQIIKRIRKEIQDAAITTDVLLGFPGENDRSFRNTQRFIEDIKPSRMHIFSYSRREGTPAAKYNNSLDRKHTAERVRILTNVNKRLSLDFAKGFIGKDEDAIIEDHRDTSTGLLTGYTDRYIRVFADGPDSLKNTLVPVKIRSIDREKHAIFAHLNPCRGIDNTQII